MSAERPTSTEEAAQSAVETEAAPEVEEAPAPPVADEPPPPRPAPVVVPRWIQLVLLPLALVGVVMLARAAGPVLLIFMIAALIALLLNPFVTFVERTGLPRGACVGIVMISLLLIVGGIGAALANPIGDQVSTFRDDVPRYVQDANDGLTDLQKWLDENGVDIQVAEQGQTAFETLGKRVAEGSGDVVRFTREALVTIVEASIAVILVIVLSIYMLLYGPQIGRLVRSVLPPSHGSPEDDYPTQIQRAVFGYVRGQLLFSTIMGMSAGVGLFALGSVGVFSEGRDFAIAFGLFYGFAELIPYVGPAIGAAPPVIIALFGDPLDAVWLTIFFILLQQIEGHIVAPQVFARSLRINPLLVIFALLMGGQLYGFIGAFISLPIAAILRETAAYAKRNFRLEPWGPEPALATSIGLSHPVAPRLCPECGANLPGGAATCPACGTELGPPGAAAAAAAGGPG